MSEVLFGIAAVLTLGGGLGVVATRNVVHAALFLLLSLVAVAGLYLLLFAEFLALVQVLIYGGAIIIVLLFAIMLTRSHDYPRISDNPQWPLAIVTALAVFGVLAASFLWNPVGDVAATVDIREAGHAVDLNGDDDITDKRITGPFDETSLRFDLDSDGLISNTAVSGPLDEEGPYGVDLNGNGLVDNEAEHAVDLNGNGNVTDTDVPGPFDEPALGVDLDGDGLVISTDIAGPLDEEGPYGVDFNANGQIDIVEPGFYEAVYGIDLNRDGDRLDIITRATNESGVDLNGDGDTLDIAVLPGFYEAVYGAVLDGDHRIGNAGQGPGLTKLGDSLFTEWAVPFEVASLVLLVALIGAIIIAQPGGSEGRRQ